MVTTVTEIPGFLQVATGNNIQQQPGNPPQYLVSRIAPYPNDDLIVGNTYRLADPAHPRGILVELVHAPGGGMQTATFQQQT
jgi:hypothetical protein